MEGFVVGVLVGGLAGIAGTLYAREVLPRLMDRGLTLAGVILPAVAGAFLLLAFR